MIPVRLGPAWWTAAAAVVVGVLVVRLVDVRGGGLMLGLTMLACAAARAGLSASAAGALAVRSRWFDVGLYLLAAGLLLVSFAVVKLP